MELLLVDDHRLFRDGMVMLLQRLDSDVAVLEAANGEEGLNHLAQHDFDLAIIDYQLPDINGIDLLQKIKQLSPATPVVIMSGHEEPAIIKSALDRGASGFLPKTLEPEEITDALLLILEGAFYVPPFIIERLSTHKAEAEQYSDLAQLAEVARRIIREKDWGVRAQIDGGGENASVAKVFNTVLDSMERERDQLEQFAFYDSLTGLPNRRLFEDRLLQALKNAKRKEGSVALVALDLDKFKQVNDTFGHDVGDELLKCVANRLQQCIRDVDTAARLGGDEFMVILPEVTDLRATEVVIQRLLEFLRRSADLGGRSMTPSTSIGVAMSRGEDSVAQLMKKADIALYQAKQAGRDNYRFYQDHV